MPTQKQIKIKFPISHEAKIFKKMIKDRRIHRMKKFRHEVTEVVKK